MSSLKQVKVIVYGRVQGVGYRYFVNKVAKGLKLTGWVMNCQNETVEIRLEGDKKLISACLNELEKGNPFARVDKIDTEELYQLGGYRDFSIRYL